MNWRHVGKQTATVALPLLLVAARIAPAQQPALGGGVYGALGSGLAASGELGLVLAPIRVAGVRYLWSETHGADIHAIGVFLTERRSLMSVPVMLDAAAFASWQQLGGGTEVSPAFGAGISLPVIASRSLMLMFSFSGLVSTKTAVPLLGMQGRFEFH